MIMTEYIKKLIKKYNNMESNGIPPEREYYLGSKLWRVSRDTLLCNGKIATKEQMIQFERLKYDFDVIFLNDRREDFM